MSADNYILIDKKTFKVYHCTASCVKAKYKGKRDLRDSQCSFVGKGKTLSDTVRIAKKEEKNAMKAGYYIEYGVSFEPWCK